MLSIEDHPDHSCSLKVPALVESDEKTSDRGILLEEDPSGLAENQSSHFSIRDYALTLRSKDIRKNWPFPRQYLHLCLRHGVKEVLPPFEPPDLVRGHCGTRKRRSKELVHSIDDTRTSEIKPTPKEHIRVGTSDIVSEGLQHESHLVSTSPSVLESSGHSYSSLLVKKKLKVHKKGLQNNGTINLTLGRADSDSTVTIPCALNESSYSEIRSVPEAFVEQEFTRSSPLHAKVEGIQKLSQKKCKLIVKLGSAQEPLKTSEMPSMASSMVSDSMASKLCPVCKTFSSTSNTTLNAHIDQCLSVEATTTNAVSNPFKHRVKPTRKRLMVDIYSTAVRCTLEDLDRRNGSSWAVDLSFAAPSTVVSKEIKRPKPFLAETAEDKNEGAVYVDSNGTKVCILSKLSTRQADTIGEASDPKMLKKDGEQRRKFISGKKGCLGLHSKHMKVKQQNKKLSSQKFPKDKAQAAEVHVQVKHEMRKSLSQQYFEQNDTKNSGTGTPRQKIYSRQCLPEMLNGRFKLKMSQNPMVETDPSDSGNSSTMKNHVAKTLGPTNDVRSLKTKSMNILSGAVRDGQHSEKRSLSPEIKSGQVASGLLLKSSKLKLKLPKYMEGCNSSTRCKEVDILTNVRQKSEKVPFLKPRTSESCHAVQLEDRNNSISTKNTCLENSSSVCVDDHGYAIKTQFASKKLRTHRSVKKFAKEIRASSGDVNDELRGGFDSVPSSNHQASMTNRLTDREKIMIESGNVITQLFSDPNSSVGVRYESLGNNYCRQTESLSDMYIAGQSPLLNVRCDPCKHSDTNPKPSEDRCTAYDANMNENVKLIGGTEAWVELFATRSSRHHHMDCGNEASNDIVNSDVEMASRLEFRESGKSCSKLQYMEFGTDGAPHFQVSNACQMSPRVSCPENHQDHSCVTSNRTLTNDDRNIVIDGETAGSPISADSTISHPSTEDSKGLVPENLGGPSVSNDTSRLQFHDKIETPCNANSSHVENICLERQIQESKAVAVAHDALDHQDNWLCCCSNRESAACELRSRKDSGIPMPVASSLNSNMSSYSNHQGLRSETLPSDIMSPRSASGESARFHCRDSGSTDPCSRSQSQCSTNPVLRLMGKNLMVINNEDGNMQLQKDPPLNNLSNAHCPSSLGHSSSNAPYTSNHPFQHSQFIKTSKVKECDLTDTHHVPSHLSPMPMTAFMETDLHGMKNKDLQINQKRFYTCNVEEVSPHYQHREPPYAIHLLTLPTEVVVIDDSPDINELPRGSRPSKASTFSGKFSGLNHMPVIPLFCLSSQYPFQLGELHYGAKPGFPVSCPRANIHSLMQGNNSEHLSPLLSSQFIVPSLSTRRLTPTLLHSPILRQRH